MQSGTRILFCSPCALNRKLGAAKTLIELAEALEKLGWQCDLVDPARVGAGPGQYPEKLLAYLKAHASAYDIVEFDYKRLYFERSELPPDVLFVARCQLLLHHFLDITIPPVPTVRDRFRARLFDARERRHKGARIKRYNATLQAADLIVVANEKDKTVLGRHGLSPEDICVFPYGLSPAQHRALHAVPVAPPAAARVAFIGMYGPRKGGADFPDLVRRVTAAVPDARFRLLGTRGRYRSKRAVLSLFPRTLRSRIEVIPSYAPEHLPDLLAPCAVGVFPSYVEGFGYAVLEMLSAALPVVAYDAPGPPAMLPPAYLVPPGDTAAMSTRVAHLLLDPDALAEARRWARQRAQAFDWQQIAPALAERYLAALAQQRAGTTSPQKIPPTPPYPYTG